MTYRRAPTAPQRRLIVYMLAAVVAMAFWTEVEVRGVLSPAEEDTYSEWVWDLPAPVVGGFAVFHALVGLVSSWAALHFIEGHVARRLGRSRA